MSIPVYNPTSTIDSIRTKIAASYSITSSVSAFVREIAVPELALRLRRTCRTRTSRTMALGHYRRIHLPISSILFMAVEGYYENARWVDHVGWGWSGTCGQRLYSFYYQLTIYQGLELLQRVKRPLLPNAEVKNQWLHRCSTRGKVAWKGSVRCHF